MYLHMYIHVYTCMYIIIQCIYMYIHVVSRIIQVISEVTSTCIDLHAYYNCEHYFIVLNYLQHASKNISRSIRSVQLLQLLRELNVLFMFRLVIVLPFSYCFTIQFWFDQPIMPITFQFCPRSHCNFLTYLYTAARHSAKTTAALLTVVYRSTPEKASLHFHVANSRHTQQPVIITLAIQTRGQLQPNGMLINQLLKLAYPSDSCSYMNRAQ